MVEVYFNIRDATFPTQTSECVSRAVTALTRFVQSITDVHRTEPESAKLTIQFQADRLTSRRQVRVIGSALTAQKEGVQVRPSS